MANSISGSITLKRLKRGASVILSLRTDGAALYQAYNDKTQGVSPDWTVAANQPTVCPEVSATGAQGATASITQGTWLYNGVELTVGSTSAGSGFYVCTNNAAFAVNPTDGYKLKIIKNIASASNTASDTLTFRCGGEVEGSDYEAEATTEIMLQQVGSSAAAVYISGACVLSTNNPSAKLTAHFFIDGDEKTSGYTYKWTKEDGTALSNTSGGATQTVERDDIDAVGGVYCSVYQGSTATGTAMATDFHKMTDIDDEYELEVTVDKEWNGTDEQTVTAHLYAFVNGQKGEDVSSKMTAFKHTFVGAATQTELGTATTNPAKVGSTVWGKLADQNEDIVDYVTVEY